MHDMPVLVSCALVYQEAGVRNAIQPELVEARFYVVRREKSPGDGTRR